MKKNKFSIVIHKEWIKNEKQYKNQHRQHVFYYWRKHIEFFSMQNDNKNKKTLSIFILIAKKIPVGNIMDEYKKNIEITFTIKFSYGYILKDICQQD